MTAVSEDAVLFSELPDEGGLPLGAALGGEQYAALMRRAGFAEGEAGTLVSAFNSSI